MSLDYPNRNDWLAKRYTPRHVVSERVFRAMPETGKNKDPCRTHAYRRRKGPLVGATGPGSINAEAEVGALIDGGFAKEAAAYIERHNSIRGCPRMSRFALWFDLYKAGDSRARGVVA